MVKSAHSHEAWSVDSRCINCMASRTVAATLIQEKAGRSAFVRQPSTADEVLAAWRAALVCPTASIHAPGKLRRPAGLYPHELAQGVYRLGFNARASFGAHSYFAIVENLRFMIDAPRWARPLVDWMSDQGGLDHILLTHQDDVADAQRYAKHFGARVWIHEGDVSSVPCATDVMYGWNPQGPTDAIKVIYVPGHTQGSVMYLAKGEFLFTGDSLAWDILRSSLQAFPEHCWYDWATQLRSLSRLRAETFSWVLAGHGGSITLPPLEMRAQLDSFISKSK